MALRPVTLPGSYEQRCWNLVAPRRSRNRTSWPARSRKTATVDDTTVIVPCSYGFPQPGGGLPDPSLSGCTAVK